MPAPDDAPHREQRLAVVGRLAGAVAHDFNNVFGGVLSNVSLIRLLLGRQQPPPDPRVLQRLDAMAAAAERGGRLGAQLVAFARRPSAAPARVDVNDVVRGLGELLQLVAGSTVRVETALHEPLWPVRLDAARLEVALLQLAVGAREAMAAGATLTLQTGHASVGRDTGEEVDCVEIRIAGGDVAPDLLAPVRAYADEIGGGVQVDGGVRLLLPRAADPG